MTGAGGLAGVVGTVGRRFVSTMDRSTNAGCRAGRSRNGKCSRTTRFSSFRVASQGRKTADFARHDQRLDLPLQAEAPLTVLPFRSTLAHALDLDFADR